MKRRTTVAFTPTPSTPPLLTPLGNETGTACFPRDEHQGPSPIDYDLELDVEFLSKMVVEMQEGVARKARRMVLKRTLGGRPTIKVLNKCLKLHLSPSFISTTLLTQGFFDEEGAKSTRRITTIEWCGMNLSFFRYVSNFDAKAQGVEALLTHTVKVQFPDLHDQFRNVKALTIMASNIGDVLEIEPEELYMKRPVGLMITVEICDISKLDINIRIPSMAESATPNNTTLQKILYSSLPNQC